MRKILGGLAAAVALVAVVLFLRQSGHKLATTNLDRALANLPPGVTATHGVANYDPILGTFSVADLTISKNGAPVFTAARVQASGIERQGQDTTPRRIGHLTIEDATLPAGRHAARIELDGLDIADIRDVLDPAHYPGGKPAWTDRRVLIEHADMMEFSDQIPAGADSPAGVSRVKHAHVDKVVARPFDLPPTQENLHNPQFWASVVRSVAEKSGTVEKVDVSLNGAIHYTIGSDEVQGLDGGKVASLRVSDMRVERSVAGGEVKLANASLEGIDITPLLPLLPQMAADPKNAGKLMLGGFRVAKMHMDGGDVVVAKAPHIQLGSMDGAQDREADGKRSGSFAMKSLSLAFDPTTMPPAQAQSLQRFGMTDFVFDLDMASAYDPAGHRSTVNRFDLAARGLGKLHMTGSVTGKLFDEGPKDPQQALQALHDTLIEHLQLQWDDGSLTTRLLTMAAASKGVTPDAMRAQLSMATMALAMVMPNQPDAATQVNAFLANPKTLTITLNPPQPVSVMDVAAAPVPQRAGLLGLHIQAE
jgi:hypothetical protein